MKKVIELVLEETEGLNGINAISIVEHPAIEENFITLAKEYEVEFKAQDEEKRILMGAALIPNKTIYRNQGGEERSCGAKRVRSGQAMAGRVEGGMGHAVTLIERGSGGRPGGDA